jgi:hypothetical protein
LFENTVGCGRSILGGGRGGDAWRDVVVIDLSPEGCIRMSLLIDVLMVGSCMYRVMSMGQNIFLVQIDRLMM